MSKVQCRAVAVGRSMTHIDTEEIQARKKDWELQQKKQQLLAKVNTLLGQK